MTLLDWLIVTVPVLFVMGMGFYSCKYVKSVADFLVAGRLCGRYVISVGDVANALAIMTDVAESGFSPAAAILIDWYETGTDNTASDPEKAAYWRARAARPVPPAEVKTRIYPVSTT